MKKRDLLIFSSGVLITFLICIISIIYTNRKMQKEEQYYDLENNSLISMMLQDETGEYKKANQSNWPTVGYNFNKTLSKCENGSHLAWRNDKVVVNTITSDKCYIYFDLENGTEQFPYQIDSIEDLVRLSNEVNAGDNKANKTYVLTKDLDFQDPDSYEDSERTDFGDINGINNTEFLIEELINEEGSGFKPIGNLKNTFQGVFDGKNFSIKNIYMKNEISQNRFGFFGRISNDSIIKNLTLTGIIKSTVLANFGTFAGDIENSTIDNCHSYVNITKDDNIWSTGGIVGVAYGNSIIKNSTNNGVVNGGSYIGGLLGCADGSSVIIENCENFNEVKRGDNVESQGTGGIVGQINRGKVSIINSINHGDITDSDSLDQREIYAGGIVGSSNANELTIDNCINEGNILNPNLNHTKMVHLGGIVGYINNFTKTVITNSRNYGNITNAVWAGGILALNYSVDKNNNLIINKCSNYGNVESELSGNIIASGILGLNLGGTVSLINNYNQGNINAENIASGLVGSIDYKSAANIINGFNTGNISSHNFSSGITYVHSRENYQSDVMLNNVYNIGKMSFANKYGIISVLGGNSNAENKYVYNSYYVNDLNASNISFNAVPMSENDMKNQSFVTTLNNNIVNATTIKEGNTTRELKDIDPLLEGYTLSQWKLSDAGYPTLINE